MTQIGSTYGQALYDLAKEENCSSQILQQLEVLHTAFAQEPDFIRLLSTPSLSKEARCELLDDSFRGKLEPYVLNFLKILTEKGYANQFAACYSAYRQAYNEDHGILPVQAVSAVALNQTQMQKLTEKLRQLTGKTVELHCTVDPTVLGGIRLDYDGKRVDGTVRSRLDSVGELLKNTQL